MRLHRYYRRMIECMSDQMEHQMRVSWYAYQSPGDEEPTVVLNAPLVDNGNKLLDSAVGMYSNIAVLYGFLLWLL